MSLVMSDVCLVSFNMHERVRCKTNITKLLLDYVYRVVEPSNIGYALNYFFFLHKFDKAVGPGVVRNLFQEQVSLLVKHYGKADELLGKLNSKGERQRELV